MCVVVPRCNSVIEYAAYSSVWIMVAQLLHNHWYGINGHTNQGQRVLSGSTHCPSVILALGGRQPQPFRGVASSIKSLWHGVGMLRELECIQFQRITLKIYSKKCLLGNIYVNFQKESAELLSAEYFKLNIWIVINSAFSNMNQILNIYLGSNLEKADHVDQETLTKCLSIDILK